MCLLSIPIKDVVLVIGTRNEFTVEVGREPNQDIMCVCERELGRRFKCKFMDNSLFDIGLFEEKTRSNNHHHPCCQMVISFPTPFTTTHPGLSNSNSNTSTGTQLTLFAASSLVIDSCYQPMVMITVASSKKKMERVVGSQHCSAHRN